MTIFSLDRSVLGNALDGSFCPRRGSIVDYAEPGDLRAGLSHPPRNTHIRRAEPAGEVAGWLTADRGGPAVRSRTR